MTRDRAWEEWSQNMEPDPFGEKARPWCQDGCDQPVAVCVHSLPTAPRSDRDAILAALDVFNADEAATIRVLADRLMLGRQRYKPLDLAGETRNWKRELDEEAMDLVVYAAFHYLKSRAP